MDKVQKHNSFNIKILWLTEVKRRSEDWKQRTVYFKRNWQRHDVLLRIKAHHLPQSWQRRSRNPKLSSLTLTCNKTSEIVKENTLATA